MSKEDLNHKIVPFEGDTIYTLDEMMEILRTNASSPKLQPSEQESSRKIIGAELLETLTEHACDVHGLAWHGDRLITGSADRLVAWRLVKYAHRVIPLWSVNAHTDSLNSLCFSPDGSSFASGSADQTIKVWYLDKQQPVYTFQNAGIVYSVAFSPCGNYIAGACANGLLKMWKLYEPTPVGVYEGHEVAYLSKDKLISAADSEIILWEFDYSHCVSLITCTQRITSFALAHNNSHFAYACGESWFNCDAMNGYSITLERYSGHEYSKSVKSLCFSPCSNYIASGSRDTTIKLWKIGTHDSIATLQGHTGSVVSLCFSPDGNYLASGSEDHTVRIWKLWYAPVITR